MSAWTDQVQRGWLLLTTAAAGCAFMTSGLAIGRGDAVLAVLSLTAAAGFTLAAGYRAARTQWVDYS